MNYLGYCIFSGLVVAAIVYIIVRYVSRKKGKNN